MKNAMNSIDGSPIYFVEAWIPKDQLRDQDCEWLRNLQQQQSEAGKEREAFLRKHITNIALNGKVVFENPSIKTDTTAT